jgi:hypothetical protein
MGIVRVENGKMAEFWWMPDLFTLMDQLQLVPALRLSGTCIVSVILYNGLLGIDGEIYGT